MQNILTMPNTKNAAHRYRVLNRLLKTGKYTLEQLTEACTADDLLPDDIAPETIRKDIYEMRKKEGIEIPMKEGRFYYTDKRMNYFDTAMTDADVSELRRVAQILQHFDYLPQLDGLENLILKLRTQIGLLGESPEDVIAFEQTVAQGVEFLAPVYKAIADKYPLSIQYHPFDFDAPYINVYHPYFLKEFNNRWYVICFNQTENRMDNVGLDRIVSLDATTDMPYVPSPKKSYRDYYADLIGVTRPVDSLAERIVLRFHPLRAKYVKSKAWHPSQEILSDTEGSCDIGFHLIVNKELIARILEFGSDVEVVTPLHLRTAIIETLKESLKQYEV